MALHGMLYDRSPADAWYTTLSTADLAFPLVWTVRRDKLMIEQPGIHVCDPSYIEVNGHGLLTVSYNQNQVIQLIGPALSRPSRSLEK